VNVTLKSTEKYRTLAAIRSNAGFLQEFFAKEKAAKNGGFSKY
jgi:hypothetical protein